MTKNIDNRKVKLIQAIAALDSEVALNELEQSLKLAKLKLVHGNIFKATRKTISVEELKIEQNYKGIDKAKFDKLVEELDIQEPLEELLSMLD